MITARSLYSAARSDHPLRSFYVVALHPADRQRTGDLPADRAAPKGEAEAVIPARDG
jgi:hypothetical protein